MADPTAARRSALEAALRRFQPADAVEAGHRAAMLELLGLPGDPFSRHHFAPGHFTASAFVLAPAALSAAGADPDGERLLLVHHGKLYRWLQPGGHVDPEDADLVAAARREVAEETGLAELELLEPVPFDLDVHEIPPLGGDPAHLHLDLRCLFRARSAMLRPGSDAKDAAWVPLDRVNARDSDESVMRAVRKLRGP